MNENVHFRFVYLPLLLAVFFLTGCALDYDTHGSGEGYSYAFSTEKKIAFLVSTSIEEDVNRIEIPEKVDDMTVVGVGGYYGRGVPTPFRVDYPMGDAEEHVELVKMSYEEIEKDEDITIIYRDVELHIPKTVEDIVMETSYPVYRYENKNLAYVIRYNVTCDEDNPKLYSKEGKVYKKREDKLIKLLYY